MQWLRYGPSTVLARMSELATPRQIVFTKADLEEGLRVLQEKPVFTAKRDFNNDYEFQKHADGQVYYRSKDRTSRWYPIGVEKFHTFNDSELEAILAARRS